jgi:hypothetical protein
MKNKKGYIDTALLFVIGVAVLILFLGGFAGYSKGYWKGYEDRESYQDKLDCYDKYEDEVLWRIPEKCLKLLEVKVKK